jgi:photosystem II stability/assembly factor-like uncharacterized protein
MPNVNFITESLFLSIILTVLVHSQIEERRSWDQLKSDFVNYSNNTELFDSEWQIIGPSTNDILQFDFGDISSEIIYAASRDSGVYKTTNGGINWVNASNGINHNFIRAIGVHPQKRNIILAGTFYGGLYRSSNAGLNWDYVPEVNDTTILAITFDSKCGDTVFVGTATKGVFRSMDAGITWEHLSPDTIQIDALEITIDPQNSNVIYLMNTVDDRVYKSTDFGNTWQLFFEGNKILSLSVDPLNSNTIYMGAVGENPIGDSLYKSTDGGENWEKIIVNDTTHIIDDILIDYTDPSKIYIATVTGGVLRSSDAGLQWCELNDGLTSLVVLRLKFHQLTTATVFGATNGAAIVKIENLTGLNNIVHNFIINDISLAQNYPNPFNPNTKFRYSIPNRSNVVIKVYDVLGKEVATLVNEEKPTGEYEVIFDSHSGNVRNLTSGIYFYQLQAGSFVETKKMILLK